VILVGDIASPTLETTSCLEKVFKSYSAIFSGKNLICNLEGLISDESFLHKNKPVLYNHSSLIDLLSRETKPVFCLANNHSLDLPDNFRATISFFNNKGINYCGAGFSYEESRNPAIFYDGSVKIALYNACWDFLLYNHRNPTKEGVYVSFIEESKLLYDIELRKKNEPETFIIVFLHWGLDLEVLPFPMHREFARALIDAGAIIVVGSHSHCIQGGEKYKNGYIIYGLGNFFVPNNHFAKGKVKYPEFAHYEIVLEWDPITNSAKCYWFKYHFDGIEHKLTYLKEENLINSVFFSTVPDFKLLSNKEYISFFKKNRRKKFFVPVFKDYRKININRIYTFVLKKRARFARMLATFNLKKWQN